MSAQNVEAGMYLQVGNSQYPIRKDKLIIGRSPHADIVIDNSYISPYHCVLYVNEHGMITLVDLNSKNGVVSNGQKQSQIGISFGDTFSLANFEFELVESSETQILSLCDDETLVYEEQGAAFVADIPEVDEMPLLPGEEYIDGELCNLILPETTTALSAGTEMQFARYHWENNELIEDEEEETLEYVSFEQDEDLCLEVIHLNSNEMMSVDYYPINKASYALTNKKAKKDKIFIESAMFDTEMPIIENTGKLSVLRNDLFEIYDLDTNTAINNEVILGPGRKIGLVHGQHQIKMRLTNTPPSLRRTAFFRKDDDLNKQLGAFLSVFLLLIATFSFIDLNKPEDKKEVTIVYKLPTPFKDAPNIKTDQLAEVKQDNAENSKPEKVETNQAEKKVEKQKQKVAQQPKKQKQKVQKVAKAKAKKSRAKRKVAVKTVAKVDTYKIKMTNKINNIFAKSGSLKNVKVKNATNVSANLKSKASSFSSGSAAKNNSLSAKIAKVGKASRSPASLRSGAKGLVNKKGSFSSYLQARTVVLGSMDPDLLRKILRQYLPQFRHCYQKELEFNSDDIQGVVDLKFRINKNGSVSKVNVAAKKSSFSNKGTTCMAGVLKLIRFPRPKGGGMVDVRQPLNFYSEKS